MEATKKIMNQEVEESHRKMAETQAKTQKTTEEYMQYKIHAEKDLALLKQRNEFQNNKMSELTRDK